MLILLGAIGYFILKVLLVLISIIAVVVWIAIAIYATNKANKEWDEMDRQVKNCKVMSEDEMNEVFVRRWEKVNKK